LPLSLTSPAGRSIVLSSDGKPPSLSRNSAGAQPALAEWPEAVPRLGLTHWPCEFGCPVVVDRFDHSQREKNGQRDHGRGLAYRCACHGFRNSLVHAMDTLMSAASLLQRWLIIRGNRMTLPGKSDLKITLCAFLPRQGPSVKSHL